jgi:hypothetical protein
MPDELRRLNAIEMWSLGMNDSVVVNLYYQCCEEPRTIIMDDDDERTKKLSRVVRNARYDGKATLEPWLGGGVGWRADRV